MSGMPRATFQPHTAFVKSCDRRSTLLLPVPGRGRATAAALADTFFHDIPSVWCTSCAVTTSKWSQWPTVGAGRAIGGRDSDTPSNFRIQRPALRTAADPERWADGWREPRLTMLRGIVIVLDGLPLLKIVTLMVTQLATAVGLLLMAALPTDAELAAKAPRIGFLAGSTPHPSPRTNAFVAELRSFGYVEGRNLAFEWRASHGRTELLPDLVAELVRLNVDIIVAVDNPSILAAQRATSTIPIIMVLASDPVGTGFVASLARPGANITGLTTQAADVQGKALQLLKEVVPNASRVAILWNPAEPGRRALATADLAVEQPTKFEFVINLKTAKTLGLTIPPTLLLQADRVID